jgi:hypothetical protein
LPIRVAGAQIQINNIGAVRGLPGANRIHIRTANGDKEIEFEQGDKKTKIKAPAQGNIEVEITEKVNGKETTRKIEAKDLDELKKKDEGAAKILEQFGSNKGGIQINARAAGGAGAPAANPLAIKESIKSINTMIERYKGQLKNNPGLQTIIESLERNRDRMQAMLPAETEKPLK